LKRYPNARGCVRGVVGLIIINRKVFLHKTIDVGIAEVNFVRTTKLPHRMAFMELANPNFK
jgi:hypothetical protein